MVQKEVLDSSFGLSTFCSMMRANNMCSQSQNVSSPHHYFHQLCHMSHLIFLNVISHLMIVRFVCLWCGHMIHSTDRNVVQCLYLFSPRSSTSYMFFLPTMFPLAVPTFPSHIEHMGACCRLNYQLFFSPWDVELQVVLGFDLSSQPKKDIFLP